MIHCINSTGVTFEATADGRGRIQYSNVPEYMLSWESQIVAGNSDLHRFLPNPMGSDLWNVAAWSIHP